MKKILSVQQGREIGSAICKALRVDESDVLRIVIDIQARNLSTITIVERAGTQLAGVDWDGLLSELSEDKET